MLKKILIGLGLVLAVFLIVVAFQPDKYRVERSAVIAAPPAVVFGQVNDFHRWEAWAPCAKLDPAVKNTFEGPAAGMGAVYLWAGNKEVGEGRMTILESRPSELIKIRVEFVKPFASLADSEFAFKPDGTQTNQTTITWTMSGDKNFLSKAMCLVMNMDKMMGGEIEKALASLRTAAEKEAATK